MDADTRPALAPSSLGFKSIILHFSFSHTPGLTICAFSAHFSAPPPNSYVDMLSCGTRLERTRRFALLLGGDTLKSIDDRDCGGSRLGGGVEDGNGSGTDCCDNGGDVYIRSLSLLPRISQQRLSSPPQPTTTHLQPRLLCNLFHLCPSPPSRLPVSFATNSCTTWSSRAAAPTQIRRP